MYRSWAGVKLSCCFPKKQTSTTGLYHQVVGDSTDFERQTMERGIPGTVQKYRTANFRLFICRGHRNNNRSKGPVEEFRPVKTGVGKRIRLTRKRSRCVPNHLRNEPAANDCGHRRKPSMKTERRLNSVVVKGRGGRKVKKDDYCIEDVR